MRNALLVASCLASLTVHAGKPAKAAPEKPAADKASSCRAPQKPACSGKAVVFNPAVTTPFSEGAGDTQGLLAVDVDDDGKSDLVLSHSQGFLDVMQSAGDGSFELGKKVPVKVSGYGLAAHDFDGDCKPDLLLSSFGDGSTGEYLELLKGKGKGAFRQPEGTAHLSCDNVTWFEKTDLNGDGRADFAFACNSLGTAGVLLGNAKGALSSPQPFERHPGSTFGFINDDKAADHAYTSNDGRKLCVELNDGRGQLQKATCVPTSPDLRPSRLAIGDVNGDGKGDVVFLGEVTVSGHDNGHAFLVYLNKGDGTLDDPEEYPVSSAREFRIVDFDADGKADLAVYSPRSGNSVLALLHNKGDGTFEKEKTYALGNGSSRSDELFAVGDFAGNGLPGFAVIDWKKDAVSVITAGCR